MNRLVPLVLIVGVAATVARGGEKAPFRVLFSNDTTNIVSNASPYHKRGEAFGREKLEASVDETAGCADVHMLQPDGGWVSWWKSDVYPGDEHYRWLKETARVRMGEVIEDSRSYSDGRVRIILRGVVASGVGSMDQ